jgi:hypothetical protein
LIALDFIDFHAAAVVDGPFSSRGIGLELSGRLDGLNGVEIDVAACDRTYRKLPKRTFLSFWEDPEGLALRELRAAASIKASESRVVRPSLLGLELFKSKLSWRGFIE